MKKINRLGIILLAAGASQRMGRAKQLLPIDGEPLIVRTINTLLALPDAELLVVLGAHAEQIRPVIQDLPVQSIVNSNWSEGMGTSLASGVRFFQQKPPVVEAIMVTVVDQPFLQTAFLTELLQQFKTGEHPVAAAVYQDALGVPAIFSSDFFDFLIQSSGDKGARRWLMQHADKVRRVPFEKGEFDLDTPEQYRAFLKERGS